MKKEYKNYRLEEQDRWIMLKSSILGGLLGFMCKLLTMPPEATNLIKIHAAEFNCTYHKAIYKPVCPDEITYSQLIQAANAYQDFLSLIKTYMAWMLIGITIGLARGVFQIRNRHYKDYLNACEQQKTVNLLNIRELEEEEKLLDQKYGAKYKSVQQQQQQPPHSFLCEPKSTTLIGMPPIVASDGYARSLKEFKAIIGKKSPFTGEKIAPYGIIDQTLLGNLLAYIENQPFPQVTTLSFKQISPAPSKPLFYLLQEGFFQSKNTIILLGSIFTSLCLMLKILLGENLTINRIFILATIILFNFIIVKGANLTAWFDQKIAETKDRESIDDIEGPDVSNRISDRLVDPINLEILEEAVICEDGYTYNNKTIRRFLDGQTPKKSPFKPKLKFKNQYPLLWPYTQRQQEASAKKNQITFELQSLR